MAELPKGVTTLSTWRRCCLCATPPQPGVETAPAPEPQSEPQPQSEPEPRPSANRPERAGALNEPGHWDAMISYTQRNPAAELLAEGVHTSFTKRGKTVWLDIKMGKLNTAAMEEGVKNSKCVIAVVTGAYTRPPELAETGEQPDDNAYFKRTHCVNELRWAVEAQVPIQPVILADDKKRVGDLLALAPSDLRGIGDVDFIHLDRSRPSFWEAGISDIFKNIAELQPNIVLRRIHSADGAGGAQQEQPPERTIFASSRFIGGRPPAEALALQKALSLQAVHLKIMEIASGQDISDEVFRWIEKADTFLAFGTQDYAEDTGNPASTYYEAKFAQMNRKRILLIRMIPWGEEFNHLQARVLFGMNRLELEWQPGQPMPHGLVDNIVKALDLADVVESETSALPGGKHDRDVAGGSPMVRVEFPEAAKRLKYCFQVAMQTPEDLVSGHKSRLRLHGLLRSIEDRMRNDSTPWINKKMYPVTLCDAASTSREVQTALRNGLVHCLVWCARGDGWEKRVDTEYMPSLSSVAEIVHGLGPDRARPRIAVVCLQHGAQYAAKILLDAGVKRVIWLAVDMLGDSCADVLCDVIAPAVHLLETGNDVTAVEIAIRGTLRAIRERDETVCSSRISSVCGCISHDVATWSPSERPDHEGWLSNLAPALVDGLNIECPGVKLLACDLKFVQEVWALLQKSGRVDIITDHETKGMEAANAVRRRAVASEVCCKGLSAWYKHVCRVTSVDEMGSALKSFQGRPALVWIDLVGVFSADDIDSMLQPVGGMKNVHLILTCDHEFRLDDARLQLLGELTEEFDEFDIEEERGLSGVFADSLHDELKLFSTFESETRPVSLLDVFGPAVLAAAIQKQLAHATVHGPAAADRASVSVASRPVVGLYRADEPHAVLFRVCVSDVAFLHVLRDKFLLGEFTRELTTALQSLPRAAVHYQALGKVTVDVDASHFAKRYESGVLRLDNLTPHQQRQLAKCQGSEASLHITAPAGAGKTFVALHFLLAILEDRTDREKYVLFAAKNLPLAVFVAKWVAKRIDRNKRRKGILKRLHLLFKPFGQPHVLTMVGTTLKLSLVSSRDSYDLIVIDEAHHIFLDDQLRTAIQVYEGKRKMLLSDVSQGLHEGLCFPEDLLHVELTEVVRSSKRVVSAAMKFQLQGDTRLLRQVPTHHSSEGPPLKSFIFDVIDGSDRYDEYAAQTIKAVRSVKAKFDGLDLHSRLAIVVPDAEFRRQLVPTLEQHFENAFSQQFQLVDAATGSQQCWTVGDRDDSPDGPQMVTIDSISEMDGMEWLIVICVGLDSSRQSRGESTTADLDFAETRSKLYRGVTRAHMMVLVVNQFIADGWLAFLTNIRLAEDQTFDAGKTLRDADLGLEVDTQINKDRRAAAAEQDRALRARAEALVKSSQSQMECSGSNDEFRFVLEHVIAGLRLQLPENQVVAQACGAWRAHQVQLQIELVIKGKADDLGIADQRVVTMLVRYTEAKLRDDATCSVATAAKSAFDEWKFCGDTLQKAVVQLKQPHLPNEADLLNLHLQIARILLSQSSDAVVTAQTVVKEFALDQQAVDALRLLDTKAAENGVALDLAVCKPTVQLRLSCGDTADVAAEAAWSEWQTVAQLVSAEAHKRQLPEDSRWLQHTADLLVRCRNARDHQTSEGVVAAAASEFEARERRMREMRKTVQSVWDSSENDTLCVGSTEQQDSLHGRWAGHYLRVEEADIIAWFEVLKGDQEVIDRVTDNRRRPEEKAKLQKEAVYAFPITLKERFHSLNLYDHGNCSDEQWPCVCSLAVMTTCLRAHIAHKEGDAEVVTKATNMLTQYQVRGFRLLGEHPPAPLTEENVLQWGAMLSKHASTPEMMGASYLTMVIHDLTKVEPIMAPLAERYPTLGNAALTAKFIEVCADLHDSGIKEWERVALTDIQSCAPRLLDAMLEGFMTGFDATAGMMGEQPAAAALGIAQYLARHPDALWFMDHYLLDVAKNPGTKHAFIGTVFANKELFVPYSAYINCLVCGEPTGSDSPPPSADAAHKAYSSFRLKLVGAEGNTDMEQFRVDDTAVEQLVARTGKTPEECTEVLVGYPPGADCVASAELAVGVREMLVPHASRSHASNHVAFARTLMLTRVASTEAAKGLLQCWRQAIDRFGAELMQVLVEELCVDGLSESDPTSPATEPRGVALLFEYLHEALYNAARQHEWEAEVSIVLGLVAHLYRMGRSALLDSRPAQVLASIRVDIKPIAQWEFAPKYAVEPGYTWRQWFSEVLGAWKGGNGDALALTMKKALDNAGPPSRDRATQSVWSPTFVWGLMIDWGPIGAVALSAGKQYHFFICQHQGSGGNQSNLLCMQLRALGYKVCNSVAAPMQNVAGMKDGVTKSECLLIFLSGRKESVQAGESVANVAGEYEGTFTRWICHEVMGTARHQKLRFVGVRESELQHGMPDFALEKLRARTGGKDGGPVHNEHVEANLQLMDDICFIPFRRQEHEVPAMLTEIIRQATLPGGGFPNKQVIREGLPPEPLRGGTEPEPAQVDATSLE